jgi:uncharacterized membrane protein YedE/YeeE
VENFTPISGLIGGLLIGLATALMMLFNGQIAGISGIVGSMLAQKASEVGWRAVFVAGLLLGAFLYMLATGGAMPVRVQASLPVLVVAGSWWASAPAWVRGAPAATASAVLHASPSARSSLRWCSWARGS